MDNLDGSSPKYVASLDTTFGKEKKCQWLWALWFYAGLMTAALIVLAVVGSIHLKSIEECDQQNPSQPQNVTELGEWKYVPLSPNQARVVSRTRADDDGEPELYLNIVANKEILTNTNGTLQVMDFNKRRMSFYTKEDDVCHVTDEMDPDLVDVDRLKDLLAFFEENPDKYTEEVIEYESRELLTDHSKLPPELQWTCAGKNVYMMYRSMVNEQHKKKNHTKRRAECCKAGDVYCCKRFWMGWCKKWCEKKGCCT